MSSIAEVVDINKKGKSSMNDNGMDRDFEAPADYKADPKAAKKLARRLKSNPKKGKQSAGTPATVPEDKFLGDLSAPSTKVCAPAGDDFVIDPPTGANIKPTGANIKPQAVATEMSTPKATPVPRAKAMPSVKGPGKLRYLIVVPFLLVLGFGGFESFAQYYMPELSLVAKLHTLGYLTGVEVFYRPSRSIWRPMGWIGSAMMVTMMLYSVRKRLHALHNFGSLKVWLRIHIFLGLMGPLLITLHTTFKLGGLIATSFFAMVITVCFGILGRYIYSQIPRSLSGSKLKERDIDDIIAGLDSDLSDYMEGQKISELLATISAPKDVSKDLSPLKALLYYISNDLGNYFRVSALKKKLKREYKMPGKARRNVVSLVRKKSALIRRKTLLSTSQNLLNYWHVVHIPLAVLMFAIMFIHIAAYYVFRPVV